MKKVDVVGVVNVSPESFSERMNTSKITNKGRTTVEQVDEVERMLERGATWVDIGAVSTKPGADSISVEIECGRLEEILLELGRRRLMADISVDAFSDEAALLALDGGCRRLNLIGGLAERRELIRGLSGYKVQVWVYPGHERRCPAILEDRWRFFQREWQMISSLSSEHVEVVLDLGIGFGTSYGENLELIRNLANFVSPAYRLGIGVSRKAHLGRLASGAGQDLPLEERLEAELVVVGLALQAGVQVFRTHEVVAVKRTILTYAHIGERGWKRKGEDHG